ncbi:hypothetical protein DQX05_00305 [Paenibacillus thiaminolyticus]|uniref:Transposase n=1 Tax=Paenibacillus thiaminolyticus TaxID=49283 RepID=A0A3A3GS36_PANTH|nr:hypothetical protein DQX05_00305 [Paenibacillus thiaminolyticus]
MAAREVRRLIVNPLLSKRTKSSQLRKVKTDGPMRWHLADMFSHSFSAYCKNMAIPDFHL